jgi:hypothetical protein
MLWLPRTEAHRSSLADAVKASVLSNARQIELQKELDVVRAQVNRASAKDFNAGRLFRLEIDNADLQKELSLYKVALDEARQLIISNAQQSQVDFPKQIETLRGELRAAESALLSSERSRDAALKELDRLRLASGSSNLSAIAQRFTNPGPDDVMRTSTVSTSSPSIDPNSTSFSAIFQSSMKHRSVDPSITSFSHISQSLTKFSVNSTAHNTTFITPHTPSPVSLAGIGIRLSLDSLGRLAVKESTFALLFSENISFAMVWFDSRAVHPGGGAADSGALAVDGRCLMRTKCLPLHLTLRRCDCRYRQREHRQCEHGPGGSSDQGRSWLQRCNRRLAQGAGANHLPPPLLPPPR